MLTASEFFNAFLKLVSTLTFNDSILFGISDFGPQTVTLARKNNSNIKKNSGLKPFANANF